MIKELEFFITENHGQVKKWAAAKEKAGAIVVGETLAILWELNERTTSGDDLKLKLSGAWLEYCVSDSVALILHDIGYAYLPDRRVSGLSVDLRTCIALRSPILTIEGKRNLLIDRIGNLARDRRLTILPKLVFSRISMWGGIP